MVTKAEYEKLNDLFKSCKKGYKEQEKIISELKKKILEKDEDIGFYKRQFKEMKKLAEKAGSELAVYKRDNAIMSEKIEHYERMKVKE